MRRPWLLLPLALILGCHAPTPPKAATKPASQSAAAPLPPEAVAALKRRTDPRPRYRNQLRMLLGVAWRSTGALPKSIEPIESEVFWKPAEWSRSFARTITTADIATLKPEEIGYLLAPDGASASFWYLTDTGSPLSEAFGGPSCLNASPDALAKAATDARALFADGSLDEEQVEQQLLWAKTPAGAGQAAAANFTLRALLEWAVLAKNGTWPASRTDLAGASLAPIGSVPGLEVYWDPIAKLMYTRFSFAGMPPHLAQVTLGATNRETWVSLAHRSKPGATIPKSAWQVM